MLNNGSYCQCFPNDLTVLLATTFRQDSLLRQTDHANDPQDPLFLASVRHSFGTFWFATQLAESAALPPRRRHVDNQRAAWVLAIRRSLQSVPPVAWRVLHSRRAHSWSHAHCCGHRFRICNYFHSSNDAKHVDCYHGRCLRRRSRAETCPVCQDQAVAALRDGSCCEENERPRQSKIHDRH